MTGVENMNDQSKGEERKGLSGPPSPTVDAVFGEHAREESIPYEEEAVAA